MSTHYMRPVLQVALLSPYVQREVLHHGRGCSEASPIVLPNKVTPEILALLLTYCRFHRASGRSDKVLLSALLRLLHAQCSLYGPHCQPLCLTLHPCTHAAAWPSCGSDMCGTRGTGLQERKLFDERFIRLDTRRLCELTSAADALDMKPLVDLTSKALARLIEGKTPEQVQSCAAERHIPEQAH